MIGVLIVTHHQLAEALLSACDLIVGRLERLLPVSLDPNAPPEESRQKIASSFNQVNNGDGVLILTDMFGGTPSNISLSFFKDGEVEVVTGVNLPMLVRLHNLRGNQDRSLRDIAIALKNSGQRGITVASEVLHQK